MYCWGALITPHGPPDTIYRAWRAGRFELITSMTQLEELRRASRYPKLKAILPAHLIGTMINNLQRAFILNYLPPLHRMASKLLILMMAFCWRWLWRLRPIIW